MNQGFDSDKREVGFREETLQAFEPCRLHTESPLKFGENDSGKLVGSRLFRERERENLSLRFKKKTKRKETEKN